MIYFVIISLFVLGLVMGSFYTVIGMRRPLNQSIIKPGSHCEYCNHSLKWYELIPVLSYLLQKGKCRSCGTKLSILYPSIELLTGILFAISFVIFGYSCNMIIMILLSSLMVIIFVSDFKYYVILDGPLIIFGILILLTKYLFLGLKPFLISILTGLIMFIIMYLIKLLGDVLFKRESLGGGDIKLTIIMGITLDFPLALFALVASSFIAMPYALFIMIKKKEEEMPFGPFLISSCLLIFVFAEPVNNIINMLLM